MRRIASEILRDLEMRIARLERLTPNQKIMVYHSTTLESAVKMINGFDTLKIRTRQFNGPKHRGLFVSPMPLTQFGSVIFEIEVMAKFLHGTDYSGNIGRKNQDPHKDKFKNKDTYLENKYPDSFRPFLTESLNYESEPQALYLGLVKPSQIKRVQYNGQWMSREQFISISETNEYAKKLKLPAYVIFPDKTLIEMAKFKPTNSEELEKIFGVGKAKLKKFGKQFITAINRD